MPQTCAALQNLHTADDPVLVALIAMLDGQGLPSLTIS